MSKQEKRALVEHPKTGMMVSVPESKQSSLGKGKELSPEAKAKFERAYRKKESFLTNYIKNALKEGRILYADIERSQHLPADTGSNIPNDLEGSPYSNLWQQLPDMLWSYDFTDNVQRFRGAVNRFQPNKKATKMAWRTVNNSGRASAEVDAERSQRNYTVKDGVGKYFDQQMDELTQMADREGLYYDGVQGMLLDGLGKAGSEEELDRILAGLYSARFAYSPELTEKRFC